MKFCIQNAPASTPKSIFPSSSLSLKPYSSSPLHSFTNMNRTRERGWFANQHNLSSSSGSGTPPHAIQCNMNRPRERGWFANHRNLSSTSDSGTPPHAICLHSEEGMATASEVVDTAAMVVAEDAQATKKSRGKSKDPLSSLEKRLGKTKDALVDIQSDVESHKESMETIRTEIRQDALATLNEFLHKEQVELDARDAARIAKEAELKEELESMREMVVLEKAIAGGGNTVHGSPRIKTPEPDRYKGQRDAKEKCNKNKSQQPYIPPHRRPTEAGILENATSRNPRAVFQQMVKSSPRERPVSESHFAFVNQDDPTMPVIRTNEPALDRTHQQGGVARRPVNRTTSRNSVEAPLGAGSSKQHHPLPKFHDGLAHVSDTEGHFSAATTSESIMGPTSSAPEDGSPQSSESGQDGVGRHKSPERFRKVMSQSQSRSKGHSSAEPSKKEISQQGKSPPKTEPSRHSPDLADDMPYTPIDLFLRKPKTIMLKASFLEQNREKRKDLERSFNDSRPHMLRPGMVLLKNFITPKDQIKILKKCRDTGLGSGGFYKPGYSDGAKLRLHMMCLGKDWDPQTRSYKEFRSIDGVKPPVIPDEFRKLVGDAIQASHVMIQENGVRYPEKSIPRMEPDICIVNFYTDTGKLGLHQDRDESAESIKNGLPVVSFSIGDSAEFLYGDDRDVDKAKKIELKSGDVLIFGGKSRLVFHGVPSIIPNTAPKFLVDEVNLRPGRLNLTFRKY